MIYGSKNYEIKIAVRRSAVCISDSDGSNPSSSVF